MSQSFQAAIVQWRDSSPPTPLFAVPATPPDPTTRARTIQQNRALWGCAYKFLEEATGHEKQYLHVYFCCRYWGSHEVEVLGVRETRPNRTTTTGFAGEEDVIDTLELSRFYANIQRICAEVDIIVPDPDPALRRTA
jgi:hypothetical protein